MAAGRPLLTTSTTMLSLSWICPEETSGTLHSLKIEMRVRFCQPKTWQDMHLGA
jgi:hypothetical protein